MKIQSWKSMGAAIGILLLAATAAFAQGNFKPLTGPVPRGPDGHPDLSGLWQRPYTPDMTATAGNGQQIADPSLTKDARGRAELPYTAWGKQQWDSYDAAKGDYTGACLPFGWMRSINSPDPLYIMQDKRAVGFQFEQNSWFHLAYLDRKAHPDLKDLTLTWFGDTIGRWDGDTLVLDTVGFNGKTRLDTNGHPMSDQLHITERWTRTDLGHLNYEVTVDDPKTYTKPWKNNRIFIYRPDWQIIEYSCEENNKDFFENRVRIPDFARP